MSGGNLKPAPLALTPALVAKLIGDRPAYGKGIAHIPLRGEALLLRRLRHAGRARRHRRVRRRGAVLMEARLSNQGHFKPIARGPQKGAPPSLEFVGVERLNVDPSYQRAINGNNSRRIIVGMVKEWDWALCQPLVVTRRLDGTLWILDGQHRHAGAIERGDIAHLPCVVLPSIDANAEASAFVALNTRRQRLSQTDLFLGMLAAGDERAKEVAALLEETGWRVVRSDNTQKFKPGDIASAPNIARQVRSQGVAAVREALLAVREAYPNEVVTSPVRLIEALSRIFNPNGRWADARLRVVAAMAKYSAAAWSPRAENRRIEDGSTSCEAMVEVILEAAGLQRRPPKTIAVAPQPSPRGG